MGLEPPWSVSLAGLSTYGFQLHLRPCYLVPQEEGGPARCRPTLLCSSRVGALSKPRECGYFFFSGAKPWRIEVRPR
jgi:hypothetical protein